MRKIKGVNSQETVMSPIYFPGKLKNDRRTIKIRQTLALPHENKGFGDNDLGPIRMVIGRPIRGSYNSFKVLTAQENNHLEEYRQS